MTVRRVLRNGCDVIECGVCGDSAVLTGRVEWRNAEEEAFRFRHPDEEHGAPSMQPKARRKK